MSDPIRRRSLLAAAATVSLAGCTALGDRSDSDLGADEDDDVQEESSEVSIEVLGSEILDEDQLLEISVWVWGEFDGIRVLEDDELWQIRPNRDRWVQLSISIDDLRETDIGNRLETPDVESIEGAVVETGEALEPVTWSQLGVESNQVRDDVRPLANPRDPAQGDQTWVAPLFDAPAGEIAVDVGPLLEADRSIFLR